MNCAVCGKEMIGSRIVDLSTRLPNGEIVGSVVEDRCSDCRDDYGARYDAIQNAIETAGILPRVSNGPKSIAMIGSDDK
jgi:hypothetical protein